MIKIGKGPLLQKFADCHGLTIDEVIDWVSAYVNGPWSDSQTSTLEATEAERLESMKNYINWRLSKTLSFKIKQEVANVSE